MESFFSYSDEMAPEFEPVEEITSNFDDMITAIISKTPDPRFYEEQ